MAHFEEDHCAYTLPNPMPQTQAHHAHKLAPLSNTPIYHPKSMFDRSLSLPAFRRLLSFNSRKKSSEVLIIARSFSSCGSLALLNYENGDDTNGLTLCRDGGDTKVCEEDAICRICMLDFEEDNETFKMECSCKGDIAVAHRECAIKWFSIKGNSQCDVCNSKVCNLPVSLFRQPTSKQENSDPLSSHDIEASSSWRRATMVLISNTLEALWHTLEELSEFP